jgi:hypothetical protein
MTGLIITIKLPEELVKRAELVGVQFESQTDQIISLLEAGIRKREAAQRLTEIAQQLRSLPSELKPSREYIETEIET